MGLSFVVAAIAWPDRRAPDWEALARAAAELSPDLVERIDDVHQLSEFETTEERRELVADVLSRAIKALHDELAAGAIHLTLVEVDRWTLLLDGGVTAGDDPTPTWYSTVALAESGLLGESAIPYADGSPPVAGLRCDKPLIDSVAPISRPSRLIVVAFPQDQQWEAAMALTSPPERPLLTRFAEVVSGSYSRRAKRLVLDGRVMLLGDRADPTGVAAAIARFDASGALAAVGAQILPDLRLKRRVGNIRG